MKTVDSMQILKNHLIPSVDFFFPESGDVFEDDNAKIQQAKIVKDCFQDHKPSFTHMNWQPQKPYRNPIENMWAVLQRDLRNSSTIPSSSKEFVGLLLKVLKKLSA